MSRPSAQLEVHKFGGASLADPPAVRHAVAIIQARPGPRVIVVSAITLENIEEARTAMSDMAIGHDVCAVSVSRSEPLEEMTYMKALNTVTLIRGRI